MKKILLIEDDQAIAGLVRLILEGEGFGVEEVGDGRAGAERISGPVPDLVLLDVSLPHVDGWQILNQIRSNGSWKSVPVVMLTARAQENDVVRALDAGATDYVAKPFSPPELVDRIRRALP